MKLAVRLVTTLLAALLGAAPAFADHWATDAFRTAGGALIERGDSITEVVQRAGEPMRRHVVSTGVTIGGAVGLTREQWTYRGTDGLYIVTFVGNKVARIEVVPNR